MKHIGRLSTNGWSPLCISAAELACEWSGAEGDYYGLISTESDPLISTFVTQDGIRFAIVWPQTERIELLAMRREFALVEIEHAPEGFQLDLARFDLARLKVEPEVLTLSGFGGLVAFFDARLPGAELNLVHDGCSRTATSVWSPDGDLPNTALIEVEQGVWSVSHFLYHEDDVLLWGLWFQRIERRS